MLWHKKLGYVSNTRIIKISKLIDKIDILIEKDQQEEHFFFKFKNNKDKNLEPAFTNKITITTMSLLSSYAILVLKLSIQKLLSIRKLSQKFVNFKRSMPTYGDYTIYSCY